LVTVCETAHCHNSVSCGLNVITSVTLE